MEAIFSALCYKKQSTYIHNFRLKMWNPKNEQSHLAFLLCELLVPTPVLDIIYEFALEQELDLSFQYLVSGSDLSRAR